MNTKSYILHHDGVDWNLRDYPSQRVLARFQCQRKALRQSLTHANGEGAKLVLIPQAAKSSFNNRS